MAPQMHVTRIVVYYCHTPDDAPDMPQMMPQLMPQTYLSVSYLISSKRLLLKNIAHDGSFSIVPGCTWLYLAVPGCTCLCLGLPWSTFPQTATDWPKCFCIYRLKCKVKRGGREGGRVGGRVMSEELLSPGQAFFLQCNWVPTPPATCCEANPPPLSSAKQTRTSGEEGWVQHIWNQLQDLCEFGLWQCRTSNKIILGSGGLQHSPPVVYLLTDHHCDVEDTSIPHCETLSCVMFYHTVKHGLVWYLTTQWNIFQCQIIGYCETLYTRRCPSSPVYSVNFTRHFLIRW